MKKLFLTIMILFFSIASFSQYYIEQDTIKPNNIAKFIKSNLPEIYGQIRTMAAILYFGDCYQMQVEINKQSKAYGDLVEIYNKTPYYNDLMLQCLDYWTYRELDSSVYAINFCGVVNEYNAKEKEYSKLGLNKLK